MAYIDPNTGEQINDLQSQGATTYGPQYIQNSNDNFNSAYGNTGSSGNWWDSLFNSSGGSSSSSSGGGGSIGSYVGAASTILDDVLKIYGAVDADNKAKNSGDNSYKSLEEKLAEYQKSCSYRDAQNKRNSALLSATGLSSAAANKTNSAYQRNQQNIQNSMQLNQLQRSNSTQDANYRQQNAMNQIGLWKQGVIK